MAELTMTPADVESIAAPIAQRVWELIVDRIGSDRMDAAGTIGNASPPAIITDREGIANLYGVSTATIDRWVRTQRIPSIGDGNTRRFIVADVIEAERQRAKRERENERRPDHD